MLKTRKTGTKDSENTDNDLRLPPKQQKQSKFMELLSDVIKTLSANKTVEERAKMEVQHYMDDHIHSSCQDSDTAVHPLTWWYENKS